MHIKVFRSPSIANGIRHATVRWRTLNPAARTIITTIGIIGIVLAAFSAFNTINALKGIAASVLVAVVFGVATIFQQRQSQRREHTVQLLTEIVATGHVAAGIAWIADRKMNNEPITKQMSTEERHHVRAALDYYEVISALALRGQVDVRIVVDLLGSSMIRNFDACRSYIDYRRDINAPMIYADTELFLAEYCRKRSTN